MKKACGLQLLLYVLLAAAVGAIVYRRYPAGEAAIVSAIFGGFAAYLGLTYLLAIPGKLREGRMIRRALAGERPVDGDKIAAIGRLVPTGSPLTSPITKTPAVAYKYEIRSSGKNSSLLYSGFGLTPSTIQGGQGGMRLLAYPELDVKAKYLNGGEPAKNAEAYVAATEFRDPTKGGFGAAIAEMMALYKDDDGDVRNDQKSTRQDWDFNHLRLSEWVVRPGEPVCIIGHYSSQRGGIVADPKMPLQQVTVKTGEPDSFAGRSVRGAIGYLIAGIIFLTGTIAGLTAFYANVPLEASEQMNPEMRASWPEIKLERLIENRVRPPMRERGWLSSGETVAIVPPPGTASGRVNDTFVTRAAATRENGLTTIRLDDNAAVITLDKNNRLLTLRLFENNIEDPQSADLQIARNDEEGVVGGLTYLGKGFTGCRVIFNAPVASPDPDK